jgi:hypothetical protein
MHYLTVHNLILVVAFAVAVCSFFMDLRQLKLLALAFALFLLSLLVTGCGFAAGIQQSNNNNPANKPAATAPVAVVGSAFVNDAVEILDDYKNFKNGNTGWLYTLEKGLHAYQTVVKDVADAKEALKPFADSKGQPFVDRLLALLKKQPDVPIATKMAALGQLTESVAGDKGP